MGQAREIPLTKGYTALIDEEDYERVSQRNWQANIRHYTVYAQTNKLGTRSSISLHRFLLDAPSGVWVDHRDGNGLNCCKSNLRFATPTENQSNKRRNAGSRGGLKGIWWDSRELLWRAEIRVNGRKFSLGRFIDPEEGARAYDEAARIHFGAFARVNYPRNGEQAA